MPTKTDGSCPYCPSDCFVGGVTKEITPYNPDARPPEGEWHNQCVACKKWSKAIIMNDLTQEQQEMAQP